MSRMSTRATPIVKKEIKIRITESHYDDFVEEIVDPAELFSDYKDNHIFDHVAPDGLPHMGSIVSVGDCLVSRRRTIKPLNMSDGGENSPISDDISLYVRPGMEGRVTNIKIKTCRGSSGVCRITTITLENLGFIPRYPTNRLFIHGYH